MNQQKRNVLEFIDRKNKMLEEQKLCAISLFSESKVGSNSSAKWGAIATAYAQKQQLLNEIREEVDFQIWGGK
jgi:hypothetical protein